MMASDDGGSGCLVVVLLAAILFTLMDISDTFDSFVEEVRSIVVKTKPVETKKR
jgi:hypothetical protein